MKKKVAIGIGIVAVVAISTVAFITLQNKDKTEQMVNLEETEVEQSTSDNSISEEILLVPDNEVSTEGTSTADNKEKITVTIKGRDIIVTQYEYDPTRPIVGEKPKVTSSSVIIEENKNQSIIEDNPNEGMFVHSLDDINFSYAKRDTGFSRGFALNPRGEYSPWLIAEDSFYAVGPNYTTIEFKELNPNEGNIDYWHTWIFSHIGFMQCNIGKPEGSIPYGSKFTEGVGLDNYYEILGNEIIMTGQFDITVDELTGYQLISDDKLSCKFGEGYLVEYYMDCTEYYYGEAVIQNSDGRIIFVKAYSPYQPSIKDIIMEFADTCVHLY